MIGRIRIARRQSLSVACSRPGVRLLAFELERIIDDRRRPVRRRPSPGAREGLPCLSLLQTGKHHLGQTLAKIFDQLDPLAVEQ